MLARLLQRSTARLLTGARQLSTIPPHHVVPTTPKVRGMLTEKEFTKQVTEGKIETVMVCMPDIYGRLVGKRFDAEYYLQDIAQGGTHACTYLLTCNMDMDPLEGFDFANWAAGFGDIHIVPDPNTLRTMSWVDGGAMVMCDALDEEHGLLDLAPRSMLRKQIDRASSMGYALQAASELEYYTYETSYKEAVKGDYSTRTMRAFSDVVQDYHTLHTAREEKYTLQFRRHLKDSGVPTECSKGEAGVGQHELNVRYAGILEMADRHAVYKQCLREVADQMGISVTFMAKPYHDTTGSGCHFHLSMHAPDGTNAFQGELDVDGIKGSPLFKHFLAGWLKYTPDMMPFYAPTINSYKRFISESWAPTRIAWSYDNRTAGYRVVGSGKSLRIECRIPGADCNPYLALAGSLASGMAGIEQQLEPPPMFQGDIYQARDLPEVPKSLSEATEIFANSQVANEAFGEHVVKHYAQFFRHEVAAYEKAVTDWERKRYFEQI